MGQYTLPQGRLLRYHVGNIPHPLKCMERGGAGNFSSETGIIVLTFFGKIKRLPKEVGGAPHTFSVFGFKRLFRKRWGGGFIY